MIRFSFLFFVSFSTFGVSAQTLMTYGKKTVSKQEFLRAFNRNKQINTDRGQAIRDYAELYGNFKLKVQAAEDAHLDTIAQIYTDVKNFKQQVSSNFLVDETGLKNLEKEAFDRSQEDLQISIIRVPIGSDTLTSKQKILETQNLLQKGKEPEDLTWQDIGYQTVFTMPYAVENLVYALKPGELSVPFRTSENWLIFKVNKRRPAVGKWEVAQILFALPPVADASSREYIKSLADSVYTSLKEGYDFEKAVSTFSDDRLTFSTKGAMPSFGTGHYSAAFEDAVFALKKEDEITPPFSTALGYHIVKLIKHTPAGKDVLDAANSYDLKQRLMADERFILEKERFSAEMIKQTNFKKSGKKTSRILLDEYKNNTPLQKNAVLGRFASGDQITEKDFRAFVGPYMDAKAGAVVDDNQLYQDFIKKISTTQYIKHLEDFNSEYKYLVTEFREGNLLFEIMEQKIWGEPSRDDIKLEAYYSTHGQNYKWEKSADAIIYNCSTEAIANDAVSKAKKGMAWKMIVEEANGTVQADSGRYEIDQIMSPSYKQNPVAGTYSAVVDNQDQTFAFVQYLKVYEAGEQRKFDQARGAVINDYQTLLEAQWMKDLKKKYGLKVNENVLREIITNR